MAKLQFDQLALASAIDGAIESGASVPGTLAALFADMESWDEAKERFGGATDSKPEPEQKDAEEKLAPKKARSKKAAS